MKAYVINLESAKRRWKFCSEALDAAGISYERIEGVEGTKLDFPNPDFDEPGYHRRQGRKRIPAEVGCFLGHIKAIRAFLASGDDLGLIMEDDAVVPPNLAAIIDRAFEHRSQWDLLRLSRINRGRALRLLRLDDEHHLGIMFVREKGAGAYVVNRRAAAIMVEKFLPMNVPYDIMFDREWLFGYRAMVVTPFPVRQKGFPTQIQYDIRDQYIPAFKRYWTVFPFRAAWETGRAVTRFFRMLGVIAYRMRL